jgi:hypothetical protein
MKTLFVSLLILFILNLPLIARGAPAEGSVSRLGLETATFQEPLRLQLPNGAVDKSIANYKGFFATFEKQKRFQGGGYGLNVGLGSGSASGGGTSDNFNYTQGSVSWTMITLQPRMFWAISDQIDFGVSVAGVYRTAEWPEGSGMKVTAAREFGGVLFVEMDIAITAHFGMHQAYGLGSSDAGPFWRWGLSYDL